MIIITCLALVAACGIGAYYLGGDHHSTSRATRGAQPPETTAEDRPYGQRDPAVPTNVPAPAHVVGRAQHLGMSEEELERRGRLIADEAQLQADLATIRSEQDRLSERARERREEREQGLSDRERKALEDYRPRGPAGARRSPCSSVSASTSFSSSTTRPLVSSRPWWWIAEVPWGRSVE